MTQVINYNGQLINLNGGVIANRFPIRDGLMLYVDSRIDASYPRTGTTVNDLSISALSGTLYNGIGHTPNKYFSLDGTNDFIEIPVSGDATKTYTVNFLARVTGGRKSSSTQLYNRTSFFSFSNSNISDRRGYRTFALQTWDSVDEYMLYFRGNGSSYTYGTLHIRNINGGFGDFHLYSVVYDPDTTKIYINGELVLEQAYTVGNNGFDKLWIGTRYATQNYQDQPMSGDFAFFQMYERELSQSEIQSIYSNVKQDYGKIIEDGLVLNLDADNYSSNFGSGATWHDVSPSGNDATLINGPTFQSDPPAIVFDGGNDYASGTSNLGIVGDAEFTISYWAYWDGASWSTNYPSGFGSINTNTTSRNLSTTWRSGRIALDYWNTRFRANDALEVQTWYHVAFTKVPGPNTAAYTKLYVNGVSVAGSPEYSTDTPNIIDGTFVIGRLDGSRWFDGKISDIQVYDRALTADEIEYNFNARRGRYGI